MTWLQDAAALVQTRAERVPLAVSFSTKVTHGVQQQRCVLCGNCITGCNHSAKNTVAMNYLPGAARFGAQIFCGAEVRAIEKTGHDGWQLHIRLTDHALRPFDRPELTVHARVVFLSAGTLGTTEILLRSRARYRLSMSARLGDRFSGNGDAIAFGYNGPHPVNGMGYSSTVPDDAAVGPTIAAMIDDRPHGAIIQEGAIPGALGVVLRVLGPVVARVTQSNPSGMAGWKGEADSFLRGVRRGALRQTQTYLAMAVDDGSGEMLLRDDRLRIRWHNAGFQDVYRKIAARLNQLTRAMKGSYVVNPFWTRIFGRRLMTVHPLGGCCLADAPATGVVNADGLVFDPASGDVHEGLYVCDGSIVPRPLGVNPSLTIGALSERIATRAADAWEHKLRSPARKIHGVMPTIPALRYAERLRGRLWLSRGDGSALYNTRFELVLHISAEDIDKLLSDPRHEASIIGVCRTPELPAGRRRWRVSRGRLNVLVDDPSQVETKLLIYRLRLTGESGDVLWLRGHKTVNYETLKRHPWLTLTRLPFVIYGGRPPHTNARLSREPYAGCERVEQWGRTRNPAAFLGAGDVQADKIVGAGFAGSGPADAVRLAASMTIAHVENPLQRLRYKLRYAGFFLDAPFRMRVWLFRRTRAVNPFDNPTPQIVPRVLTQDRTVGDGRPTHHFLLTHFRGTDRARTNMPVVLAPGFGMSADAFRVGNPSAAQFLYDRGYDVWLLDYRGSDKLEISLTQFTLDDLAHDFSEAIVTLYETYGRQHEIQVVAHCVASLSMQMALLNGTADGGLRRNGLHSVVLSQSFAFMDHPVINRVKAGLHLPSVLDYVGFRPVLTADHDLRSSLPARVLDRLLYLYPSKERCREGVCRRLLLLYGEVIRHDQLDQATHDRLYEMFDRANLTTFKHLAKMIARGHLVDRFGKNTYLRPENGRRVNVPITLLQGTANGLFRPSGARKTHEWLIQHGGFGSPEANRDKFRMLPIQGHGHLDNFIGKRASTDVFPELVRALERMRS